MILLFPDADAVRLALTSGLVPADVTLAPAAVSTDAHGRLYVEPSVSLSRATGKLLDRLGVKGSKRHGSEAVRQVGSWVELVPLVKESGTPEIASGTAVLFELPTADDLPAVVTELLRLGNDRQGFRWFATDGDADTTRVLLRVLGPPYYTLLRALDGPGDGMRVYLERAPRVWVAFGYTHPLAEQVRVAEGQFALLSPPATWRFVEDAPFRDVYELAEFPLPAAPVTWEPVEVPEPVTVPLRLTAGNAADAAELWVLRDDPVGRLDALVRDADERLTQRLTFAVAATADGSPVAVLRTRPSKEAPPLLALEGATGFKPYWKLPNLFLPVGRRLHPMLRRDAVRRLLADDPNRVVWLYPDGKSGFTPESVPDAAFRSLEDWVDYVIEVERAPLAAWIGATRFDFEHFVCPDVDAPRPKPDRPDREPKAKDEAPAAPPKGDAAKPKSARTKVVKPDAAEYAPPPAEAVTPNEAKQRAKELAEEFLVIEGPLDAPARKALWPQLAQAYTDARDSASDAALCWVHALWDRPDPQPEWEAAWAAAEFPQLNGRPVGAADLDARLKVSSPSLADARAVVAGFLAATARTPVPGWVTERRPAIQKCLEGCEGLLPVRAVWLSVVRLARLAGGDALGVTRAWDRVVTRLMTEGLRAERDLPWFLRFAGHRDADRLQVVREQVSRLRDAVRKWVEGQAAGNQYRPAEEDPIRRNLPYVDLMFSFAYANLGEADAARGLLAAAQPAGADDAPDLGNPDKFNELYNRKVARIADDFLHAAFAYRINQALAGKPHAGGLSPDLRTQLDAIQKKGTQAEHVMKGPRQSNNPYWQADYVIERMRKEYRVLEPNEIPKIYTSAQRHSNPFDADVANLPRVTEPAKLVNEVRRLYREGTAGREPKETQTRVVHQALSLCHRAGEPFTTEVLGWVPGLMAADPVRPGKPSSGREMAVLRGQIVERAIVLAANYNRTDLVREFTRRFTSLVRVEPEETKFLLINAAAGRALRNLRRLGLRDEIDHLLTGVSTAIDDRGDFQRLRARYTSANQAAWAEVLVTLCNLAAGWLTFGLSSRSDPVLEFVRADLLRPGKSDLSTQDYTGVVCAYVRALGSGPAEKGLSQITQLLEHMPAGRITNGLTTAPFYSRLHLNVVEEIVWAVTSDEFALGPTARKWLEEDESLVRKRINADARQTRA